MRKVMYGVAAGLSLFGAGCSAGSTVEGATAPYEVPREAGGGVGGGLPDGCTFEHDASGIIEEDVPNVATRDHIANALGVATLDGGRYLSLVCSRFTPGHENVATAGGMVVSVLFPDGGIHQLCWSPTPLQPGQEVARAYCPNPEQ